MLVLASCLIVAAAGIVLLLGAVHVLYTFRGRKLQPRDATLLERMAAVSPVISRETTMWKAWVGFNASHGFGAVLFGLVYGYLALLHADLLSASLFLEVVGLALVVGYLMLARRYWFSIPFRGLVVACSLYVAGLAVAQF